MREREVDSVNAGKCRVENPSMEGKKRMEFEWPPAELFSPDASSANEFLKGKEAKNAQTNDTKPSSEQFVKNVVNIREKNKLVDCEEESVQVTASSKYSEGREGRKEDTPINLFDLGTNNRNFIRLSLAGEADRALYRGGALYNRTAGSRECTGSP